MNNSMSDNDNNASLVEMSTTEHLENIDNNLLKMNKNLNQNLEQMNEYLKYISYAAIIWILLIFAVMIVLVIIMGAAANQDVIEAT